MSWTPAMTWRFLRSGRLARRAHRPVVVVTPKWNGAMMDDVIDAEIAEIISEQKLLS